MASKASAKLIRVLEANKAGFEAEWADICCRGGTFEAVEDGDVISTIESVRDGGDEALLDCIEEADGVRLDKLEVTREEWDEACEQVDPADRAAIGKACMRIRDFHRKRIPSSWEMREEGGGYMGQRIRPLSRVAIYAEGGEVVQPSVVVMNTVPASVVEVPEIVMVSPPRADGSVAPELLMAARVAGVHRVFKAGGAHAIAALALGTETIPRVDKIVGSGDVDVSSAKRLLAGHVAVDAESGEGEVCVVADKSATPAWLAAELLCRAERGESSRTLLITHYKGIATRVQEQLTKQLKGLASGKVAKKALASAGAIVTTKNLAQSLELADEFAPQHLVLAVEDPDAAAKSIGNAAALFLGHYTPVAVGDYVAGPNSMLPSAGTARFASPLGVDDFLKRSSFIRFEPPKLRELGAEIIRLAEVEGLSAHGTSVELRLQKIRRARREREAAREAEI